MAIYTSRGTHAYLALILYETSILPIRNIQGPAIRKEAPHLSQDKSNEGLADLYEKEVLYHTSSPYCIVTVMFFIAVKEFDGLIVSLFNRLIKNRLCTYRATVVLVIVIFFPLPFETSILDLLFRPLQEFYVVFQLHSSGFSVVFMEQWQRHNGNLHKRYHAASQYVL